MARSMTWLGHASFRMDTPGGKRVYVDPWLEDNLSCPPAEHHPERVDLIAVTHGHHDHAADAAGLAQRFGCPVVASLELSMHLAKQGAALDWATIGNIGGTIDVLGLRITFTTATHSSSSYSGEYLGAPTGLVIELEDGFRIYFAGDTGVFSDMQLIRRLYSPQLAVLPVGDRYTMGPREAALALELLGVKRCFPCHWGTRFAETTLDLYPGTPDKLRELVPSDVEVIDAKPGDTVEL